MVPANPQTIGGVTYYTHYYQIFYPIVFPNAVFKCDATVACNTGTQQTGMGGISVSANLNGWGSPLVCVTIAVTSTFLYNPVVHWMTIGM